MSEVLVTFAKWRQENPKRWAQIEGTITRTQLRTLKFLDAQIHLTAYGTHGTVPPESPEVRWLRRCITIYLYVAAHGIFPKDEANVMWVKNQRRGSLCDYQVGAVQQIPGWRWQPRRVTWDERAEHLNEFRDEYGRDPRVRSGWDEERGLANWYQRQRNAARAGKLTPRQVAVLEGDMTVPTGELDFRIANFAGSYMTWFQEFWSVTVPRLQPLMLTNPG